MEIELPIILHQLPNKPKAIDRGKLVCVGVLCVAVPELVVFAAHGPWGALGLFFSLSTFTAPGCRC